MALKYLAGRRIEGLTADTKPANAEEGSIFKNIETGEEFRMESGIWQPKPSGGALTIDQLNDVDTQTITPEDGDVLTYSDATDEWVPAAPPGAGGGEANDLVSVGGGAEINKTKTGTDIPVRTFLAASGGKVTVTQNTNDITIQAVDGSTTQKGAVELATDGENAASVVVQGNDSRLRNDNDSKMLVYKESSNWLAKNTTTGDNVSTNTSLTTVLQAAINGLTGSRTIKETVKVNGTDSVTAAITIPSYTKLDLSDAKITLANSTATPMFINSDTIGGNTQIEIIGGIIDGNKANQAATPSDEDTRNIVQFTKVTDSSVRNMYIDEASSRAIRFRECVNCIAENNTVIDSGAEGIQARLGSDIKFLNNTVKNTGYSFITTYETPDSIVAFNYCDTNTGTAPSGLNISSLRNKVIGNTVKTSKASCIAISENGSTYDASGIEVIGNILHGSVANGGIIAANYRVIGGIIQGNIIFSNATEGIRFSGAHENINITDNVVYGNTNSGIYVSGTVSTSAIPKHIHITNNISYNNGIGTGVNDYDRAGINVRGTDSGGVDDVIVKNNTCYDSQGVKTQKYGVRIENSVNSIVEFNNLDDNLTDGLASVTNTGLRILENSGYTSNTPIATTTGVETHTNKTYTSPIINAGTLTGSFNLDSTSANFVEFVKPFTNSSAESLLKVRLSEDTNSYISIQNMTSTNAIFIPGIILKNNSTAAAPSGYIIGEVHSSFDSGTLAALALTGRLHTGAALGTRPIVDIISGSTTEYSFTGTQADFKSNNLINAVINASNNTVSNIADSMITGMAWSKLSGTPTKIDDLTQGDDNTDLDSNTSRHGLMKKLSNVATEYMDGTGNWSTPAGGGGGGSGSLKSGTVQRSGDGSTVAFTITHGFGSTPEGVIVIPKSAAAFGAFDTTVNGTIITITYQHAPITGTNNLEFWWLVCDDSLSGGGGGDALTLDDLTDTTVASPAVNQSLVYQTGSGTFENKKLKTRVWMVTQISTTSLGTRYIGWGASQGSTTTEANTEITLNSPMTIKRVYVKIDTNTADQNTTFAIRRNQSTVTGTSHTVAAGVTTAFDSGEITQAFAVGDEINVMFDKTTSTTGNTVARVITEYEVEAYA